MGLQNQSSLGRRAVGFARTEVGSCTRNVSAKGQGKGEVAQTYSEHSLNNQAEMGLKSSPLFTLTCYYFNQDIVKQWISHLFKTKTWDLSLAF